MRMPRVDRLSLFLCRNQRRIGPGALTTQV
jgi:hypothetical protein